jgi:hypothetical protein
MSPRILLTLGKKSESNELWVKAGLVTTIINFEHAAPSGYRRGSRALGLGLDSLLLAIKSIPRRGPVLVTNPWIGIASKLLGRRDVAVIGLYAAPGSRSFKLLRLVLRASPIVTTVQMEADAWIAAGGRAAAVLYGNTFYYPQHDQEDRRPETRTLRIFVGGSSDRDIEVLQRLENEIRLSREAVVLVVVTGDAASQWSGDHSSIVHTGYVPARRFGELVAESDVVFLPLLQSGRAAGHMVTVGALEAGVPVASTPCAGMHGYINGDSVRELDMLNPLLPQLQSIKDRFANSGTDLRAYWGEHYSRRSFVERVGEAIGQLERVAEHPTVEKGAV